MHGQHLNRPKSEGRDEPTVPIENLTTGKNLLRPAWNGDCNALLERSGFSAAFYEPRGRWKSLSGRLGKPSGRILRGSKDRLRGWHEHQTRPAFTSSSQACAYFFFCARAPLLPLLLPSQKGKCSVNAIFDFGTLLR